MAGEIVGYTAKGHAHTAPRGQDVVCAVVSVLTDTAPLGLLYYGSPVTVKKDPGHYDCRLDNKPTERSEAILGTMVLGLAEIAVQYPEAIKIEGGKS